MNPTQLLQAYLVGAFISTVYFGHISGRYRIPLSSSTIQFVIFWPLTILFYIAMLTGFLVSPAPSPEKLETMEKERKNKNVPPINDEIL